MTGVRIGEGVDNDPSLLDLYLFFLLGLTTILPYYLYFVDKRTELQRSQALYLLSPASLGYSVEYIPYFLSLGPGLCPQPVQGPGNCQGAPGQGSTLDDGLGLSWGGERWGAGGGPALLCTVPTWCIQPCLKVRVEEVPDGGTIVFILGQPAATGECHAPSKGWGVHLYPVYKPAWSLAWREGDTELIKDLYTDGFLGTASGTPNILPYSTAGAYSSTVNMPSLLLIALLN